MKSILILFLILTTKTSYSQVDYILQKNKINNNLALLETYSSLDSNFYNNEIHIDSIAEVTAELLAKLLSKRESLELKHDPLVNLHLTTSYGDSLVRIFVFSYNTGGSMGLAYYPVIQWKRKDGTLKAHNLSQTSPLIYFNKIYNLDSKSNEFFLMLGGNRENHSTFRATAYVIRFLDGELILDYPAFYGSPFIGLSNMDMEFVKEDQVLVITIWYVVEEFFRYYPRSIANILSECFYTIKDGGYSQKQVCRLLFRDNVFKPE